MTQTAPPASVTVEPDGTMKLATIAGAISVSMLTVCVLLNGYPTPLQVDGIDQTTLLPWTLAAVVLACGILVAPWWRWRNEVFLIVPGLLVPFAVAQGWGTGYFRSPLGVGVQVAEFFVILMLVGLTQRRGVVLIFSAYVFVAYLAGARMHADTRTLVISLILTVPVAAVVGELIAWSVSGLRDLRVRDRERAADLETLARSIAQLRVDLPVDHAIEIVRELACRLLRGRDATVVLRHPSGGLLVATPDRFPITPALEDDIQRNLEAGVVESSHADKDAHPLLLLPLAGQALPYGTVVVRLSRPPDPFAVRLAELLRAEAGASLEQIQTIELLSQEAQRDALTGLGNRRFGERLLAEVRPGDAILLIDLDQFKPVNDTFGHATGDDLLRTVSAFLQAQVRDHDGIARYGGDEFLVVLRDANADAVATARRLHASWVASEPLSTMSIGVAWHRGDSTPDLTLDQADRALYRVKQRGGNAVELFTGDEASEPSTEPA